MNNNKPYLLLLSEDRSSGTFSNFQLQFDHKRIESGKYKLIHAEIPNTFYTINEHNYQFYLYENTTAKLVTLTQGIYTTSTITTMLKTSLDTASSGYNTFTVSFSDSTQKLTFSSSNVFSFYFGTYTSYNNIAPILGFNKSDLDDSKSQVSSNVVNLSYPSAVFIDIDNEIKIKTSEQMNSTFYIPLHTNQPNIVYFNTEQHFPQELTIRGDTNIMSVRLLDENNNEISPDTNWKLLLKKI